MLGELERAIECSIADVEPSLRTNAKAFVDNVRSMPDIWKIALGKIFDPKNESTLFFYFQLLEDLFVSHRCSFLASMLCRFILLFVSFHFFVHLVALRVALGQKFESL